MDVLSVAEVERLLAHCNQRTFLGARMYALIALMYDSGLRVGEIIGLTVDDIDWKQYHVLVKGKGKKQRLVPFSLTTHKALRKYLIRRNEFLADVDCDTFFISKAGNRMTQGALSHVIKRFGVRAGVPRLHPHLLRHSMATQFLMNDGNPSALRRIMGHTSSATTEGYINFVAQHLAEQHQRFSPMSKVNANLYGVQRNPTRRRRQ
ncbi:MAG: tyrosine-type recombinase/integrase [Chloroflexota bacterium]|nr:tyrosine-type recombinase/integrase [Chloroflexota bacterium]